MASSSSRRYDDGSGCPAKSPCFFKIVLESALRDGNLEIPEVVVWKHGNCLGDSVFLKVPSGAVWQTELTRSGGKAWLQKGWPEFAKFYSIKHGYLLMLSYEGDYSRFQVRIFHRNNLELDYPFTSNNDEEPNLCGRFQLPEMEELGPDVSVKAKDNSIPSGESKGQGMKHEKKKKSQGSPSSSKICEGGHGCMSTTMVSSEASRKISKGDTAGLRARAFKRASSFKSDNPFLVVKMQSIYLSKTLRLPVSFVKQHVCAKNVRNMNLLNSDGRTWPVKCVVVACGENPRAIVYDGWRAFVRDNHLKIGDTCVFELIDKGRKVTFKVAIYRTEDSD